MDQNQGQHQARRELLTDYPQQTGLNAGVHGPLTPDTTDMHSLQAGTDSGLVSILASEVAFTQCVDARHVRLIAYRLPCG